MTRPMSSKSTKTKNESQPPQQIPMNAVLEMVQRMAGVPPPPYESRNRGTKATRAANRKKKALNLPVTPPTPSPARTPSTCPSSSKPTRTITSASIHVDKNSDPANPAMSLEFTFGQVQEAPSAQVATTGRRRKRIQNRGTMNASAEMTGQNLQGFIDPILKTATEKGIKQAKSKPEQNDDTFYEREAEKLWKRISDPLCHCRKERILEKLQKHKENLQHVNDLLKARVMAYQAFGDQLTAELDSRGMGIVLVVTETPDGKADMQFKIEKKPDEVVGGK